MTDYTPRVGDKVRRTFDNGTFIEGVIASLGEMGAAWDSNDVLLHSSIEPEQTELLAREIRTDDFTVYGVPRLSGHRVVRLPGQEEDELHWLGCIGETDQYWFSDEDVEKLVDEQGWEEITND